MSIQFKKLFFLLSIFLLVNACTSSSDKTEAQPEESSPAIEEKKEETHVVDTLKPYENVKAVTTEKKSEGEQTIFIGEFIYMADAAVFFECGSNRKMAVLFQKDFIELEKTYRKVMGEEVGQRAYVVIDGDLQPKAAGEEGLDWVLVVNDVQSVAKGLKCTDPVQEFEGIIRMEGDRLVLKDCATDKDITLGLLGAYSYIADAFHKADAATQKVNLLATVHEGRFVALQLVSMEAGAVCE